MKIGYSLGVQSNTLLEAVLTKRLSDVEKLLFQDPGFDVDASGACIICIYIIIMWWCFDG